MELVDYRKLRHGVQLSARPATAAELRVLEARLGEALRTAGFSQVETGATKDADRLAIALCGFPAHHPVGDVADVLERLWEDHLRYGFWEAHTILVEHDQVELLAASRTGERGRYATLHVVARQATVPVQRVPLRPSVACRS